jgi:ABC-type multidrug transport system permease subunit
MVMSLVKSTQQAGFVVGGVMTATSMLGIFPIMMQSTIPALNTASLFTPQGWAMNALKLTIAGASLSRLALPLIVLLGASAVFFTIGVFLFRRRFA